MTGPDCQHELQRLEKVLAETREATRRVDSRLRRAARVQEKAADARRSAEDVFHRANRLL